MPIGAGLAFADKYLGNDRVTFAYFGDGAANQGQVYETYNMAELWDLPVIFVIENNQYAMGTSVKRSTKSTTLYERGAAYGIPGEEVDGMDVLAVKAAGEKAVAHCRAGKGPYILEMKTYRYRGHSMSDPAKYRTREEVQKMRDERDADRACARACCCSGKHASEDELKAIDKEIKDIVNEAAEFAKDSPEPALDRALDRHLRREGRRRSVMATEILMPALSPTMEEGTLAKWLVKEGDTVTSGQILAEIETDKATMEFEAVDEGIVGKILVAEGTEGVKVNTPIAVMVEEGESVADAAAAPKAAPARRRPKPPPRRRHRPRPRRPRRLRPTARPTGPPARR